VSTAATRPVRTPTVLQMEAVECGAACLAMVLAYHGRRVPLEELRVSCGVSRDGSTAGNLVRAAAGYGLDGRGFKREPDDLAAIAPPFVVFWRFAHFIVVEGVTERGVRVNDPAFGRRLIDHAEFNSGFTGIVLTFVPNAGFTKGSTVVSTIATLWQRVASSRRAVAFIIAAGFALVVPGLILPAFTKAFVDNVLVGGDKGWTGPLVLVLVAALVLQAALTEIQQRAILRLQSKIAVASATRFVRHVLALPMEFFAQRSAGAIAYRIASNDRVAELLSRRLAASAVGTLTAVIYLAVMVAYDALLAVITLFFAVLNLVALRLVARWRSEASASLLQEEAELSATAISGLARIETIKAAGAEHALLARWLARQSRTLNARQRFALPSQLFGGVPRLLTVLNTTGILAVGALLVMSGHITLGTLFAMTMLAQQFNAPFASALDLGADIQQIDGDVRRLGDVLHYPVEPAPVARTESIRLRGALELRAVTFGYARFAKPAVTDVSFAIRPGERVAIVGSTGSGKSTVSRLVSGLYRPWSGSILFDGRPRDEIDPVSFVSDVAFVDQDIVLFAGTVADNITLWDPGLDAGAVERSARDALIHADITARPDAYEARVEEDGANLSGGQRQRLEIARALVRDPAFVVLDEATSALDAITEHEIDVNLRRRGCSCLIVAHRLSTVRDCDQILVMEHGVIVERGSHDELVARGELYRALVTAG
jgi:NHLM bacteriocin system ABC transporter peptidase/ATP-binding protein